MTYAYQKYRLLVSKSEVMKVSTKKMGRPTDEPKHTQLGIRFDSETLQILDDYCNDNNISRAEGTRQAVRKLKKK